MSRWPTGIDAQYRQHESEQRFARVEVVMERRRAAHRERVAAEAMSRVIVDRDPGDEDGAA